MIGIEEGMKWFVNQGRTVTNCDFYSGLQNGFTKLSYRLYLKISLLAHCIGHSMNNSVGHSIVAKYDDELTRLRLKIDHDFVRNETQGSYWRELLRNQLYHFSSRNPLPILDKWVKKGHPFLSMYSMPSGHLNMNALFWKSCDFFDSSTNFEIRIADAAGTIIRRRFNEKRCFKSYDILKKFFLKRGSFPGIILGDFDISKWKYRPEDNPWLRIEEEEAKYVEGKSKSIS